MYEACKSTCHEWSSKDEVEKKHMVVEKEEFIMKKEVENKDILRKKNTKISSPQYKSELWKAIEGNNDLKFNVHEQSDDINHLKEQCDIDHKDEVQEITAATTPWKRKSLCLCDM